MLQTVHDDAVVDLVREDDEVVLARDVDELLQHLARVERAGGVVRVDDDEGLRAARDLLADVVHIGIPFRLLVAHVMQRRAAGKRDARRPQRVVGRRNQHLVAVVQQRQHAEIDELAHAVAGVHVIDVHALNVLELRVLHDGLARREQALRRRVALAFGQLAAHVEHHLLRRAEVERRRVADVELQDARAGLLHALGFLHHRPAHVVQYVVQLGRLLDLAHGIAPRFGTVDDRRRGGVRVRPGCGGRSPCALRCACRPAHAVRGAAGHGFRFNFPRALHQPCGGHAQHVGQHLPHGPAGHRFAVRILADLAFPKLHAAISRDADEIGLLVAFGCHRAGQTLGERFLLLGHHRSVSSISLRIN